MIQVIEVIKKRIYIRRITFVLAISFPLVAAVYKSATSIDIDVMLYPFFILFCVWLYLIYFVKCYKIIGFLNFYYDYLIISILQNSLNEKIEYENIDKIVFHFNEVKGGNYSGVYFGIGTLRTKDGINNYIDINDQHYQILIESDSKLRSMKYSLDVLIRRGVNVKLVDN